MNDRFKFRVWYMPEYDKPRMIYGAEKTYDFMYGEPEIICADCFGSLLDSKEYILMQCTGLKDKNGKLIYEGDIVNQIYEDETIYKCEVVYNNCSFQLKHIEDKNKNYINTPMYCYAINYLGHYTEKRLEVIGNIYQDSHLLEN